MATSNVICVFFFTIFIVSKKIFLMILFIYSWQTQRRRERGRDTGRGRSRLHAGSPMWDPIPGLQDHTLGQRQMFNHWATQASHGSWVLKSFFFVCCTFSSALLKAGSMSICKHIDPYLAQKCAGGCACGGSTGIGSAQAGVCMDFEKMGIFKEGLVLGLGSSRKV